MSFWVSRSTSHSTLDTRPFLLDHRVRPRQHVRRNRETNLLSGFEIDDELELRPVRTSPELLGFERKPLWVSDDFFAQINIEFGPIEVARRWLFYV